MANFLSRRVLQMLPVLVGITLFSFVLIHLVPGNPVAIMVGGKAPPGVVRSISHQLGLDRPLLTQYFDFVWHALQGNLGESIVLRRPVASVVGERIGASIFLLGYGSVIGMLVSLPLGIASARWRNRLPDHLIRLVSLIAFAMPSFWLALILVRVFSLGLGWLPVSGYGQGFVGHIESLTLPAVTIGLFLASMLIRALRSTLIEVLDTEYIEAARARGASERRVFFKHGLRNALIGMLTILAVNLGFLIGGAVIVEQVFDIPGLGQLLIQSIFTRDFPTIQALALVFGVLVIVINLASDIAYAAIDPRVRLD